MYNDRVDPLGQNQSQGQPTNNIAGSGQPQNQAQGQPNDSGLVTKTSYPPSIDPDETSNIRPNDNQLPTNPSIGDDYYDQNNPVSNDATLNNPISDPPKYDDFGSNNSAINDNRNDPQLTTTALNDQDQSQPSTTVTNDRDEPQLATTATDDEIAPSDELLDIKHKALTELGPLVEHLDQSAEEKFKTLMMMIQATDNKSLVHIAFEAAHEIEDDKARAQALLDVINEINYFTKEGHKS